MSEHQYLDLLKNVLENGQKRSDRTNTGTLSLFAPDQFKFDLFESFPLFTTKKVFFRGIVEELLFFLRGDTDSGSLSSKNVHIWDQNSSREFLDNVGLTHYKTNLIGPMYGFQWRFWGASYDPLTGKPTSDGIDQLKTVINFIKTDPFSRRIVMSCWNVKDLSAGCLNPCHILVQFYVSTDGLLHSHVYQRSIDIMAGLPFNIASYAMLTQIIAHITDLKPGTMTYSFGDVHLYLNHVDAATIQIQRTPQQFPQLKITKKPKSQEINDLVKFCEELCYDDFVLENYNPLTRIPISFNA
jgi:thymidylate synthase